MQIGKEGVKQSLSADDMILYIDNLKEFTKTLLERISKFSKVAGYKITHKSLLYFHTLEINNLNVVHCNNWFFLLSKN